MDRSIVASFKLLESFEIAAGNRAADALS